MYPVTFSQIDSLTAARSELAAELETLKASATATQESVSQTQAELSALKAAATAAEEKAAKAEAELEVGFVGLCTHARV